MTDVRDSDALSVKYLTSCATNGHVNFRSLWFRLVLRILQAFLVSSMFMSLLRLEGSLLVVDQERERFGLNDVNFAELTPPELEPLLREGLMFPEGTNSATYNSAENQVQTQVMTGKRGASPTELLKKDKMGEVALAKRPSMKRGKSTSSGDSTGSS